MEAIDEFHHKRLQYNDVIILCRWPINKESGRIAIWVSNLHFSSPGEATIHLYDFLSDSDLNLSVITDISAI